ncbi:protein tyrosine phosphatase-like protein [Seiridium cupressi]
MTAQKSYLIAYNAFSFLLWSHLTFYTATHVPEAYKQSRLAELYTDILPLLSVTQTLALLEVVHAALGLVRASPAATALQIGGKNLVVWTVMVKFPEIITGNHLGTAAFFGCVLAWGCSEIIRYGFFVVQLTTGDTPSWLKGLRYNAFLPLYPIGLVSEAVLVYLALTEGTGVGQFYKAYLLLGLLTYLPVCIGMRDLFGRYEKPVRGIVGKECAPSVRIPTT